jgi:hypothetical protein
MILGFQIVNSPSHIPRLTMTTRNVDKALCILNLGVKWRRAVNFLLRPLYDRWKSPRHPQDRKAQSLSRHSAGEEEIPVPAGTEPRSSSHFDEWDVPVYHWCSWYLNNKLSFYCIRLSIFTSIFGNSNPIRHLTKTCTNSQHSVSTPISFQSISGRFDTSKTVCTSPGFIS